jgi:histidine triad (HIT) family protein
MVDSIFTKIIKGEIPCEKVYEDDKIIAFLDIHPIQPGHTLVLPKEQVSHFDDLDDQTYQNLFNVVKKVAKKLKQVTGAQRACLRIEGFDVHHAHVHVYPCNNPQDFYGDKDRMQREPDHAALAEMAKKLAL